MIIRLTGSSSKVVYEQSPAIEPNFQVVAASDRTPDVTVADRELHWKPRTTLEEGLKRTISYFKSTELD
jgi:UDP-glucuronate decarboxylase